jgi:hypothetical protein
MPKKKLYIAVKCGLIEDAKHREAMGNRLWVYLYMLNRTDWDAGQIWDWRDKDEAEAMSINLRTLRIQRQELADLGYITCQRHGNHQIIIINNWTNPRSYSGKIINQSTQKTALKSAEKTVLLPDKSTPESTVESSNEFSTSSFNSKNQITEEVATQKSRGNPELFYLAQALSEVCHMDLQANKGRLMKEAKLLSVATPKPTPELLRQYYNGNKGTFWRSHDWRGQKGEVPTPASVRETWGAWEKFKEIDEGLHYV